MSDNSQSNNTTLGVSTPRVDTPRDNIDPSANQDQPSQGPNSGQSQPAQQEPQKPANGQLATYNIMQACSLVREQTKCGDLRLDTAYQITDGSAIEFIDKSTGKQLAAGRLRFANSLFVDQGNGNISVPAYISDLSFFKSALNVKVSETDGSQQAEQQPASSPRSDSSSPRSDKVHRAKKTGSAKLVKHNRRSTSQVLTGSQSLVNSQGSSAGQLSKSTPKPVTADSLLDFVD